MKNTIHSGEYNQLWITVKEFFEDKIIDLKEYFNHKILDLKELMNEKFSDLWEKVNIKISSIEKGIIVALAAMEKRLDGMNEFRATLNDFIVRAITKDVFDAKIASIEREIDQIKEARINSVSRIEHDNLAKEINDLREWKAAMNGMATQKSVNLAFLVIVINIIIGLIGVAMAYFALKGDKL